MDLCVRSVLFNKQRHQDIDKKWKNSKRNECGTWRAQFRKRIRKEDSGNSTWAADGEGDASMQEYYDFLESQSVYASCEGWKCPICLSRNVDKSIICWRCECSLNLPQMYEYAQDVGFRVDFNDAECITPTIASTSKSPKRKKHKKFKNRFRRSKNEFEQYWNEMKQTNREIDKLVLSRARELHKMKAAKNALQLSNNCRKMQYKLIVCCDPEVHAYPGHPDINTGCYRNQLDDARKHEKFCFERELSANENEVGTNAVFLQYIAHKYVTNSDVDDGAFISSVSLYGDTYGILRRRKLLHSVLKYVSDRDNLRVDADMFRQLDGHKLRHINSCIKTEAKARRKTAQLQQKLKDDAAGQQQEYSYAFNITLTLRPFNVYEYVRTFPLKDGYVFEDVPMKLTNLVLHECQIEMVDRDTQRRSLRRYTQQDTESEDAMIYVPVYGCAYEFVDHWFKHEQEQILSDTKELYQQLPLNNTGVKSLVSWFFRYLDREIATSSLMSSLQFADCHQPNYYLLPSTFKLSRLLIEYLPVMHVVKRVIIPFVGYNEVCFVQMTATIGSGQPLSWNDCVPDDDDDVVSNSPPIPDLFGDTVDVSTDDDDEVMGNQGCTGRPSCSRVSVQEATFEEIGFKREMRKRQNNVGLCPSVVRNTRLTRITSMDGFIEVESEDESDEPGMDEDESSAPDVNLFGSSDDFSLFDSD